MAGIEAGSSSSAALSDIASGYIPPEQPIFEQATKDFSDIASMNFNPDFSASGAGNSLFDNNLPDFGLSGSAKTDIAASGQGPVSPAKPDDTLSSANQDWLSFNSFDFGLSGQSGLNFGGVDLSATNSKESNSSSNSTSLTSAIKPDLPNLDFGLSDANMFDASSKITASVQAGDLNVGTTGSSNANNLKQDISGSSSREVLSDISRNLLSQEQTPPDQTTKAPINIASANQNLNFGTSENGNFLLGDFTDFGLSSSGKADGVVSGQGSKLPVAAGDNTQNASPDLIASNASKNTDMNSKIGDLLFLDKNEPFSSSGIMLAGGVDMGKPSSTYTKGIGIPDTIDGYTQPRPGGTPAKPNPGLTGDDMIKKQVDDLNRGTNKINKGFSVDLDAINPGTPEATFTQKVSATSNSVSLNVVEMGKITSKDGTYDDLLIAAGVGWNVKDAGIGVGTYKVGSAPNFVSAMASLTNIDDGFGNFDPSKADARPLADWVASSATYIGIAQTRPGTFSKDNNVSLVFTDNGDGLTDKGRLTGGLGKQVTVPVVGGNLNLIANGTGGLTYDQSRLNGTLSYGGILDIPYGKEIVSMGLEAAEKGFSALGKSLKGAPGVGKGIGAISTGMGALAGGLNELQPTPRIGIASSNQAELYIKDDKGNYLDPFDPATTIDPLGAEYKYITPKTTITGTMSGIINAASNAILPGTYLIPGNIDIKNEVTAEWEQDVTIPAKR